MGSLTTTEWAVLKTTADDAENLEQIYQQLHNQPQPVPLAAAADAVRLLIEKGLLAARMDAEDQPIHELSDLSVVWRASFMTTPKGKEALIASSSVVQSHIPLRPSLFGTWKEHQIHLTQEDLAEIRCEMWRSFPREFPE